MKNKLLTVLIVGIMAIVGLAGVLLRPDAAQKQMNPTITSTAKPAPEYKPQVWKVYIAGEVEHPGVYEVNENDRVEDVIKMAGGAKSTADLTTINLSTRVKDQETIVIPAKGQKGVIRTITATPTQKATPSPKK